MGHEKIDDHDFMLSDDNRRMEWRLIPGWEAYEVSDHGVVRRAKPSHSTPIGKVLSQIKHTHGYRYVCLCRGTGDAYEVRRELVHRLVLESFVGPQPPGQECLHYDGDKTNNRVSNLRWGTRKENVADTFRQGNGNDGERNGGAKLAVEDVALIKASEEPPSLLARRFGVAITTIREICRNENWRMSALPTAATKRHGNSGTLNAGAKLNEQDVLSIRRSSLHRKELAAKYGVSPGTIGDIRARRKWASLKDC